MDSSWLPKLLVPAVVSASFAAFRRLAPAKTHPELERYDRAESARLPTGSFAAITVTLGVVIAVGGYFALRSLNHAFAKADSNVLLQVFPVSAIWSFLPGFAALAVPWPLMIAVLRRTRFPDDAAYIEAENSAKAGFDCYRVLVGMVLFVVLPIGLFTVLALPERLTLTDRDIEWTHYASVRPEVFAYTDARRATFVDGYLLRDGSFRHHPDLVLDFVDGRRLSANATGDGGSVPSDQEIRILLERTGLTAGHLKTREELPPPSSH